MARGRVGRRRRGGAQAAEVARPSSCGEPRYNEACGRAQTGDAEAARARSPAIALDGKQADDARADEDFAPVRTHPRSWRSSSAASPTRDDGAIVFATCAGGCAQAVRCAVSVAGRGTRSSAVGVDRRGNICKMFAHRTLTLDGRSLRREGATHGETGWLQHAGRRSASSCRYGAAQACALATRACSWCRAPMWWSLTTGRRRTTARPATSPRRWTTARPSTDPRRRTTATGDGPSSMDGDVASDDVPAVMDAAPTYQDGRADLRRGCVDPMTNTAHCGMCDHACAATESCTAGACRPVVTCATGETLCAGTCVTTATDDAHCGMCGRACAATERCVASVCTALRTCPMGQTDCAGPARTRTPAPRTAAAAAPRARR